jgi:ferritin-like metal-binding protein YciE
MLENVLERVKINDADELFLANLASALRLENTVEKMLESLAEEARGAELTQQLRHHREETHAQIRNLQQVFRALGKEPDESPCLPIDAIEKQGQVLLKLADESIKDEAILAGCAETEHLEIAVYESLIAPAGAMGHGDVVALLRENLEQEQHTLGEVLKATLANAQREAAASR